MGSAPIWLMVGAIGQQMLVQGDSKESVTVTEQFSKPYPY